MSKLVFDQIAEGLTEALAVAREETKPARLYVPPEMDVRGIRKKLKMTQEDFASSFGFTLGQIRDWEQGRSRPLQAHRAFLLFIERCPNQVQKALQQPGDFTPNQKKRRAC